MEVLQVILAVAVWVGAFYLTWCNRQHENHMRQILECMEKERKLYQIISQQTTEQFMEALGRTRGVRDDE